MKGKERKKCVICDCILDESNKSSEHIIHNAIGGILEDEGIYCKACNSQLGSKTVVLSTHYNLKALNEGVVNIIDANAKPDTELLRELTPDDYKDMDIIACQYHIDIKKEIENLRKYHDYDNMDSGTQWTTLCDTIGKRAYNTYRTKPYKREYSDMIHEQYSSIKWLETSQTLQSNFDL